MELSEIRNIDEYHLALGKVSDLMNLDPAPGSPEFDLLERLSALAEAYEIKLSPIDEPDPAEVINFRVDQMRA